jgi:CRP-like cAMP-binding protein
MTTFPTWWPQPNTETNQPAEDAGIWVALQNMLDVKQSKPTQAESIVSKEMTDGSGRHFMLKNARTHTYTRLSPEEFWIWQKFNGEKTVQQIVLDYFMEYKSFAFAAVVNLIGRLREQSMLSEPPQYLYAGITRELQEQTVAHKATWLARMAFTKEWSIKGLDSHLDRIYKYGGWLLFTLPLQIAFLLVSIIGTFLFLQISKEPQYALFGDNAGATMLKLGLLTYIPLLIHEFGHALAAKHFGCEVYKGGAMLYYGLPAAFVDTTDVWMHGKRARLAVTWAGPYTGYIIGGASAILVYFWKGLSLANATSILQIGLIGLLTSTMNLLPILKLDGYYILADALEIPRLRERSMEFIVKGLRPKLTKREKWTRDETIFLVFGALAFLSTFYFTYAGIRYWDHKTTSSISNLIAFNGTFITQLKNFGAVLLAVSSITYSLYILAMQGSSLVAWLRNIGLLSHRLRSAIAMIVITSLVIIFPPIILPTLAHWFMLGTGIFAFGLAGWLSYVNYRKMRGSIHAGMWVTAMAGFALGAAAFVGEIKAAWSGASVGLYKTGLALSLLSFLFAGRLLYGMRGSWRSTSISLIVLGIILWFVSLFIHNIAVQTLTGLLILSGLIHWNMRPSSNDEKMAAAGKLESTRQRMVQAFQSIRSMVLSELEKDFGAQTRTWVEHGYYRKAQAWFMRAKKIEEAQFNATMTGLTPNDYGGALALNLEELLIGVEKAAGKPYAVRALAFGYDNLDWEQQELAEDYILKYVKHAEGLSQQLADTRNDVGSLLRSVPLFMTMTDKEIAALCKQLKSKRCNSGDVIIQQGDMGDAFYIVRAGSVEVTQRFDPHQKQSVTNNMVVAGNKDQAMIISKNRKLTKLGRGEYFGEVALLTGEKRNATVRAVTPVEVLWLKRNDFNKFVRENFDTQGKAQTTLRRLAVLRQIPLFSEFQGLELSLLEKKLEQVEIPARATIFKHGDPGNHFYIIESGKVSVQVPFTDTQGESQIEERAALGSGEYFGEIALLMDAPRTATIVAAKPTTLLCLDARAFGEILSQSREMKQALERTSSRRVLSNERWSRALVNA